MFQNPLELHDEHVIVYTESDGEYTGILRSIQYGWIYLELMVYHVDSSSGVRSYHCFMKSENQTTCMLAQRLVKSIEKIHKVIMPS